jgi:ATP-dependent Lon protease
MTSQTNRGGSPMPKEPMAALPLRSGALFPGTTLTLSVGRPRSLALLRTLYPGDVIVTLTQRTPKTQDPTRDEVYDWGTLARVESIQKRSETDWQLTVTGLDRAKLVALQEDGPFLRATVEKLDETNGQTAEAQELAAALVRSLKDATEAEGGALAHVDVRALDPGALADMVASQSNVPTDREVALLAELDVPARIRLLTDALGELRARGEMKTKIDSEVRQRFGKIQREAVLREQLKAIQKELGDAEGDDEDAVSLLRRRLDEAGLPEEARKVADRELGRLAQMGGQGAEVNVIRNYLELIADLPWSKRAEAKSDVGAVEAELDRDHYGLEDVKKRILEHMAVLGLSAEQRGTLLCLVGPPGVGKTSLGESIAKATGRPFVRVALGGVRDEAEIRGHRRTYVGALPGRILHALRKAKVKNPVVLLDEIDKLSQGFQGSPEAALLEVLDPEQNHTFTDHYLEIPFDLSEVLFLCTANTLETLSAPLRDRLEVVELSGYTPEEKIKIARAHLLPKRTKSHGLDGGKLDLDDAVLETVIRDYTREAGVRQLDREVTRLCRAAALDLARRKGEDGATVVIRTSDIAKHLGKPRFEREAHEGSSLPGMATGLAWTPFGGSTLFIETSRMPGKGHVEITGQLGDVMKESARAALSYVRSNAKELGLPEGTLEHEDVHIHVPAGAVPKDGPSAGVTIFTALTSLFTGRRVRQDTAMTGEATLRGRVLAVGGIKAKVLAAHRAGITRVILPAACARDLDDVPQEVRSVLEVVLVDDMRQVLDAALEPGSAPPIYPSTDIKSPVAPLAS